MEGGMQDNAGCEADCLWTIIWCADDADVSQAMCGLSAGFMSFGGIFECNDCRKRDFYMIIWKKKGFK